MELIQVKRNQRDVLRLSEGRIEHEWSLVREKGFRSTEVKNIDSKLGRRVSKTEGKVPYLFMMFMFFGLFLGSQFGDQINLFVQFLFLALAIVSGLVAAFIRNAEIETVVYLTDGSIYAVIRHSWVSDEMREAFCKEMVADINASLRSL